MEGDHFSLCWNNFHRNLSSGFHSLYKDEDLVDVTLATADGRYIKAHKTVLSVCSPFFKDLFRVNPCKHPIVILPDVNYEALTSLMQFMYQGEVSVSQEEIAIFMKVAELLKVKGLTDNNSSTTDSTNGYAEAVSRSIPEYKPSILKRPRSMIKNIPRTLKPWRPIDTCKLEKSPSPHASSTATQIHPSTSPGIKKLRLENDTPPPLTIKTPPPATCTSQNSSDIPTNPLDLAILKPKDEPVDHSEEDAGSQHGIEEMNLETASGTLDGTASDVPAMFQGWPTAEMQAAMMQQDTSSPGTIQCILGRRGTPRLIVDGHVFFKKSVYKGKAFWYCRNSRIPEKCPAVAWTMNGNIVKWPYAHSHPVIPDVFNPEEDTEVPIENLQEVLWQTSLRSCGSAMFLKSGRGQSVMIHQGHIYTQQGRRSNYGLWVCVKQKKFRCNGTVWTLQPGPIVITYLAHNHPELTEDIRRLQLTNSASISPELRL